LLQLRLRRHRPDVGAGGQRIADLDTRHTFRHRLDEARVDPFGDAAPGEYVREK